MCANDSFGTLELMERSNIIGIAAIVIILAAIFGYSALQPAQVKAPATTATTTAATNALPAGGYVEHAAYYDIDTHYATSTPLGVRANTAAIALMKNFASDTITQFKTDGNFANLTPNDITTMGFDKGRKEKLQILYLMGSSTHTFSYIFTINEDTLGAHGNTFFKTFTFDTSSGAPLALANIFLPDTNYLDTLSTMSRAKLPAIIGPNANSDFIKGGTTPDEKNFANFFFDNRDFVILFPPYAVAAYSDGPQTLRIPLSELSNILQPEYRQR